MNTKSELTKIALVTGASSGIGQATAELLARTGYKVYGTSRRGGLARGRSFAMLPLDVTNDGSVDATVRNVLQAEGRIAICSSTTPASASLPLARKKAQSSKPDPSSTPTSSGSCG